MQFVHAIKNFQQILGALASSLTSSEKSAIYDECKKFLFQDEKISKAFNNLNQTDQEWVSNSRKKGNKNRDRDGQKQRN